MNNLKIEGDGRFIVNDDIVVFDVNPGKNGIEFSVDWNDENVTEEEAMSAAEDFIKKTLAGVLNNKDEEVNKDVYIPQ
jgi:hypothetical protein